MPTDPCSSQPCYDGVQCMHQNSPPDYYRCGDCPPGYVGDGKNCTEEGKCPSFGTELRLLIMAVRECLI